MAGQLTLQVANRGAKGVIRKLPPSITVEKTATVEEVKKLIAQRAGIRDVNRLGLYDPQTKQIIKNRNALIDEIEAVVVEGRVLVQDLGMCSVRSDLPSHADLSFPQAPRSATS